MRDIITVFYYEFKMQIKNIGFWIVLLFCLVLVLLDSFPSQANILRLDHQLSSSGYIVTRMIRICLLILFGYMFLVSSRIRRDKKTGASDLLMATKLKKKNYIFGKIFANYCLVLLMMAIYFAINIFIHLLFNPDPINIIPFIIGFCIQIIPISFFVVACSVAIPVLIEIRLFYIIFSALFIFNVMSTPDTRKLPFYLLIGEPIKLVNSNIGFGIRSTALIFYNLLFLIGIGAISIALLMLKKNFWRECN